MTNSKTTLILGWMCLIGSFFVNFGVLFICSSIFLSVHFIIETLKKNRDSKLKPFLVKYDYVLSDKSTIVLAFDYNSVVEKFKKEFKNNYYRIKEITEQSGNKI